MMRSREGTEASRLLEEDRKTLKKLVETAGDGSILRGWRKEMDPQGLLEISFQEFIQACARLNFFGDTMELVGLDGDPNHFGLKILAPDEWQVIMQFRYWFKERFESPVAFFSAASKGETVVTKEDFQQHCHEAAPDVWSEEELDLVFECCDYGNEGQIILEDLVFIETDENARTQILYKVKLGKMMEWRKKAAEEYWFWVKEREAAKKEGAGFPQAHRKAPRPWLERYFEDMPTVKCLSKVMRVREACKRARRARLTFLDHTRKTYGHDVRAWRRALAPQNTFCMTQRMLRSYIAKHGLQLAISDIWRGFDYDKDGVVTFEDYNGRQALSLARFQRWAHNNFGSCAILWEQPEAAAISRQMTGIWFPDKSMQLSTFKAFLKALYWPDFADVNTRRDVLSSLDLHGFGTISKSDLVWLDSWHPREWVIAEPDPAEWARLKAQLVKTYGHLLKAWRLLLDVDDSNHLSWAEFRDACKRIKFDGNVGACWRALDTDMSGTITMNEYDKESFEILCSFKEWAELNFGSISHCFRQLDEDHSGSVSLKELRHACRKLRWEGDVKLLFDCVNVSHTHNAGVRCISLHDLAFLDNWQVEPTEAELAAEDPPPRTQTREQMKKVTKKVAAANDRLASPLNIQKLGFQDWATACSTPVDGLSQQLPPLSRSSSAVLSPYAQPLIKKPRNKARAFSVSCLRASTDAPQQEASPSPLAFNYERPVSSPAAL